MTSSQRACLLRVLLARADRIAHVEPAALADPQRLARSVVAEFARAVWLGPVEQELVDLLTQQIRRRALAGSGRWVTP
jgi:hypothetical protein